MHLLRTMAGACAVGALSLFMGGAAQAQTTATKGPYLIRIGGYLPSNGDTKEALGTNFLSYGVGVNVRRFDAFLPTTLEIYGDYFNRIKNHDVTSFGRIEAQVLAVGVLAKYSLDPNNQLKSFRPYFGTGVGIYWARIKQTTVVSPTDQRSISQKTNRTTLGGKLLLGAEMTSGVFGELEYTFAPRPSIFGEKVTLSGGQLRLGYHF